MLVGDGVRGALAVCLKGIPSPGRVSTAGVIGKDLDRVPGLRRRNHV
jgi:hypothetical protein